MSKRPDSTEVTTTAKLEMCGAGIAVPRDNQHDELKLVTHDAVAAAKLKAEGSVTAHVVLKDGRTLDLSTAVAAPRPQLTLLSKNVQLDSNDFPPMTQLGNPDQLPQDGRLSFFLKTKVPETFPPEKEWKLQPSTSHFTSC